jgi:hypothetical protein
MSSSTPPPMSRDPFYVQYAGLSADDYKPLGNGPAGYGRPIPRMKTKVDARSLGYADPRVTIDMQIARREGDDDQARKAPVDQSVKEGSR